MRAPRTAARPAGRHLAGEGWLAAGDATVAHDPFSAHGITMALGGGLHAAAAVCEYLSGHRDALREYAALLDAAFARYLLMHHERYLAERRWPREPFWRRRHAPRAFGFRGRQRSSDEQRHVRGRRQAAQEDR